MAAQQLQNEFTMSWPCDKDICSQKQIRGLKVVLDLYLHLSVYVGTHDSLHQVELTQRIVWTKL